MWLSTSTKAVSEDSFKIVVGSKPDARILAAVVIPQAMSLAVGGNAFDCKKEATLLGLVNT